MTNMTEAQILYDDILSTEKNSSLDILKDLINYMPLSVEDRKKLFDALEKRREELKNNILKTEMRDNFSEFIEHLKDDK